MKKYRVSFDLMLDDDSSHPRKWVPDAIWSCLRAETGEDVDNIKFDEVGYVAPANSSTPPHTEPVSWSEP